MGGLDLEAEVLVAWPGLTLDQAIEVAQILDDKHNRLENSDPQLAEKLLHDFLDEEPLRKLNKAYDLQISDELIQSSESKLSKRSKEGWNIVINRNSYMYSEKCSCEGGTVQPIGGPSYLCPHCIMGVRQVEHLFAEVWKARTGYTEVIPRRCRSCPSWDKKDKRKKKTCLVLKEATGSSKGSQTDANGTCSYHGEKGVQHVAMRKKARKFLKANNAL